jgi:RimJ/RimL family protein N-acetyltransferase
MPGSKGHFESERRTETLREPSDPIIRTSRLLLRPLAPADAEPLFALFADWEVVRWLSMPPWPYTLDDAKSFIGGQLDQGLAKATFAITLEGVSRWRRRRAGE